MQKCSLLKNWFNIKVIVSFLIIPILKVLAILMHTYFKDLEHLFVSNTYLDDKWVGGFSEDDSSGGCLRNFGKDERNVILVGGISGGFDRGATEFNKIYTYIYNEKMRGGASDIKTIYEDMKNKKMRLAKWVCEQLI